MTCSGRFVTAAILVMEMELVLVARKRGRNEIVEFGGEGDARAGLVGLVLRELLFRHLAGEVGAYGVEATVKRCLINVVEKDIEAGAGADVRDAVAHGPGAQDCNGFRFGHKRVSDDFRV